MGAKRREVVVVLRVVRAFEPGYGVVEGFLGLFELGLRAEWELMVGQAYLDAFEDEEW